MKSLLFWVWLLVMLVCLTGFLSPQMAAAQKDEGGLMLMFIPGANFERLQPGTVGASYLELRNTSDKTISEIRLSSDKPAGWEVAFKPDVVKQLNAGGVITVDMYIKPPESANRGDYRFTAIAEAEGIRRITSVYVNVQPAVTVWLWIGLALAVVLIAGFLLVFMRMNR